MKTLNRIYYILFALILCNTPCVAQRQDLQHFEIDVWKLDKFGLSFYNYLGTSQWNHLSFTDETEGEYTINHIGVVHEDPKLNNLVTTKGDESKHVHFKFTAQRLGNTVKLKGIKGTAWKELSFSFSDDKAHVIINEYGIVNKEQAELPKQEK
jgi:hypothetical protein